MEYDLKQNNTIRNETENHVKLYRLQFQALQLKQAERINYDCELFK